MTRLDKLNFRLNSLYDVSDYFNVDFTYCRLNKEKLFFWVKCADDRQPTARLPATPTSPISKGLVDSLTTCPGPELLHICCRLQV